MTGCYWIIIRIARPSYIHHCPLTRLSALSLPSPTHRTESPPTMPSSPPSDRQPLLPAPVTAPGAGGSSGTGPPPSRTRLSGRRLPGLAISERARGKQRAVSPDPELGRESRGPTDPDDLRDSTSPSARHRALAPDDDGAQELSLLEKDEELSRRGKAKKKEMRGRHVTIIFSNEAEVAGGNLEVWVDEGETVGSVKDQVSDRAST